MVFQVAKNNWTAPASFRFKVNLRTTDSTIYRPVNLINIVILKLQFEWVNNIEASKS